MRNPLFEISEVRLGDISKKIGSGATPRGGKESYKSQGISLIRSMNVHDLAFDYSELAFIDQNQARQLNNVTVKERDILLNITGASVARCCMVPRKILPARVNQHVAIIRCELSKADPTYIQYCLVSPKYKESLLTLSQGGATREALTKEKIEDFKVPFPSLPTQHKIACILSAYDDLIENNTRRITILEEMAQRLYREWFVHFRYPGHENAKLVESELGLIPEGWEVLALGDIASINSKSISKANAPETIHYINISSVSTNSINSIEAKYFRDAPSRARRIVNHGDIIWSTVRPNRKSFALIYNPPTDLIVSTGFAVITAQELPYSYLYYAITTDDFAIYLANNATGSAYPAVNESDFANAKVLVPSTATMEMFHSIVETKLVQINILSKRNKLLGSTRDSLLPKLISGKINVSELDIETSGNEKPEKVINIT
ncbi:restriction endonuclease subunit S [candidate division KSB1 bacterium]|nr:restriction endonuclease subunit S [candidate division KSB1 bacterium]RQW00860.1 MAG: restriction endonuclease subunit S [candidate division KSB1 bacterium]